MVLRITDEAVEIRDGECIMSFDEFIMPEMHPFIATTNWEMIYIDLCDKTPKGIIRQMVSTPQVVPVIKSEMSPRIMSLLCEIFVDESAQLRAYYRTDRNAYDKLVQELIKR